MTLRDATHDDLIAMGAESLHSTVRAIVAELDGETVGVAGLQILPGNLIAFSRVRGALRSRKRDIIRLMQACEKRFLVGKFVLAIADPDEPTSATLLEHFGFRYARTSPIGEVYARWP